MKKRERRDGRGDYGLDRMAGMVISSPCIEVEEVAIVECTLSLRDAMQGELALHKRRIT
jgi:hypothetical protein